MTEIKTDDQLRIEYEKVLDSWAKELRETIPLLESWWEETNKRLEEVRPRLANIHWPAGLISHPRIICIYRRHFFALHELNRIASEVASTDDRRGEEQWGTEGWQAGRNDLGPSPIPPNVLLLDDLEEYAPDISMYFRRFAFRPIGEDQRLELC